MHEGLKKYIEGMPEKSEKVEKFYNLLTKLDPDNYICSGVFFVDGMSVSIPFFLRNEVDERFYEIVVKVVGGQDPVDFVRDRSITDLEYIDFYQLKKFCEKQNW